jgi:hypothetical protein
MHADLGQFGFQGHKHKIARRIIALVQIYGGHDGLEGLF